MKKSINEVPISKDRYTKCAVCGEKFIAKGNIQVCMKCAISKGGGSKNK